MALQNNMNKELKINLTEEFKNDESSDSYDDEMNEG